MSNLAFHTYKDVDGQWRWRLVASNGRIIANSGEGYFNRRDLQKAIDLVVLQSGAATIEEVAK